MTSAAILLLTVLLLNILTGCFSLQCHHSEYPLKGDCCPTCPPGKHVRTDCTQFRSTTCSVCKAATFMDKPNGFKNCFECQRCDADSGLRVKTPCTATSDAVCEPLEGFYCVDPSEGKCAAAKKHSSCPPGQYISRRGSSYEDSQCSDCSEGTFSPGNSSGCRPHTQCQSLNQLLIKPGNSSADAECEPPGSDHTGVIVGVTVLLLLVTAGGLVLMCIYMKRREKKQTVGLEGPDSSGPSHIQPLKWNPDIVLGQPEDMVPPVCPGSSSGSPPGGPCQEQLSMEASRRPGPPQLGNLHVEEQSLYPRLLQGDPAPHPDLKGDAAPHPDLKGDAAPHPDPMGDPAPHSKGDPAPHPDPMGALSQPPYKRNSFRSLIPKILLFRSSPHWRAWPDETISHVQKAETESCASWTGPPLASGYT